MSDKHSIEDFTHEQFMRKIALAILGGVVVLLLDAGATKLKDTLEKQFHLFNKRDTALLAEERGVPVEKGRRKITLEDGA